MTGSGLLGGIKAVLLIAAAILVLPVLHATVASAQRRPADDEAGRVALEAKPLCTVSLLVAEKAGEPVDRTHVQIEVRAPHPDLVHRERIMVRHDRPPSDRARLRTPERTFGQRVSLHARLAGCPRDGQPTRPLEPVSWAA